MDDELIEIYDLKGDFLGTAMSEAEAEILCRNARELGFNPISKDELGDDYE